MVPGSSEMLVTFYQTTRRYIPGDIREPTLKQSLDLGLILFLVQPVLGNDRDIYTRAVTV
jgi:hypothetical protein